MGLYLRYAVRSDLGLVRGNNEDSVYAGPRLLAIADGMGGHAAGEVASKIVISAMEHLDEDRRIDDLMGSLRETVEEANRGIADAVAQNQELEGMGTTLTALRFVGSQIGMVHVGDSRAYLLRGGELAQITHDDTYVQYLVDTGKLTADEAKDHPRKSVILRALLGTEVEPDVSIREARAGDRYLLCSDGLSDVVSTQTIAETMVIEDPQEAADRLVELALRGGGPDNVTVIVADVVNAKVGDSIDDVPVIAGAFVDPAAAEVPGTASGADSAAERAARISRAGQAPPPDPPTPVVEHRRRRRWRPWMLAVSILAIVVLLLGGVYVWTQGQYFVGESDSEVAIFQGVDTTIGPVKLFSVYRRTGIRVDQLDSSTQSRIRAGIAADSAGDAQRIVTRLRTRPSAAPNATPNVSQGCPSGVPQSPSADVAPSSGPSGSTSASKATSPSGRGSAKGTVAGAGSMDSTASRSTRSPGSSAAGTRIGTASVPVAPSTCRSGS